MGDENENLNLTDIRSVWTDAATKCLLQFMAENMNNVGKSFALKNKSKLWQRAAQHLETSNWNYTTAQVETKFRALERQYKKKKLNNNKTGRSRMTCPYEDQLEEIFKQKKGINPDYTLGVEYVELAENSVDLFESPCSDSVPSPSPSKTCKTKEKHSMQGKVFHLLQEIAEDRKKEHEELMDLLKQKEKQKEERQKQKEEFLLKLFEKK